MLSGAQILGLAQGAIGTQTVDFYRFVSRTANTAGKLVATYAAAVPISCNFQPLPRTLYQQFGLDLQRAYYTLICHDDVGDIRRGADADQIAFFGRRYNCESNTEWYKSQGYAITLCVDVGAA